MIARNVALAGQVGFWEGLNMSVGSSGVSLSPASGSGDLPVAVINGAAPVATTPATWGEVKGTFR